MSLYAELKRRNVLRVAAAYLAGSWLVFQIAETVLPVIGYGDGALRIVLAILAIGLVPAIVGAWIFEVTPDGIRFDADAEADPGDGTKSRHRLDRAILIVLTLAVAYFAVDKFIFDPARDAVREAEIAEDARSEAVKGFYGDQSIAVLPFVNLSADPEQEYFAEGISEEILNLLAKIRELRVISRSSAFTFKGSDLEIPEIARRLDVGYILEGSTRKFGDQIRVTAQLIEARTDTHLWSESYEGTTENLFELQDRIAALVAEQMQISLLEPLPRARPTSIEVVALTAQAKQLAESRPDDVGQKMQLLLDQALEIDPDYVPALEWRIVANFFLEEEGVISAEEQRVSDLEMKNRILELDPGNAVMLAFDAWNVAHVGRNFELGARLYEEALRKDSSHSNIVRLAGVFARKIGDFELSTRLGMHSVAIDPLCYQCLYQLSRSYLYAGEYELALEMRERFLAISERGGQLHYVLTLMLMGNSQNALDHLERNVDTVFAGRDHPQFITYRAMALFELGRVEEAADSLEHLIGMANNPPAGANEDEVASLTELISMLAGWMGNNDLAFEWLAKIKIVNYWDAADIFTPEYRRIIDDPRWEAWRESIDMSTERMAAINFNPELPAQ